MATEVTDTTVRLIDVLAKLTTNYSMGNNIPELAAKKLQELLNTLQF